MPGARSTFVTMKAGRQWKRWSVWQASGLSALPKNAGFLPVGTSITLHAWQERTGGEDFHARDLLTDVGGINVEAGFSAEHGGENVDAAPRPLTYS